MNELYWWMVPEAICLCDSIKWTQHYCHNVNLKTCIHIPGIRQLWIRVQFDARVPRARRRARRRQTTIFLRAADRAGSSLGPGQAADALRHIQLHHQALPLLPHRGQGLAELYTTQLVAKQVSCYCKIALTPCIYSQLIVQAVASVLVSC